MNDKTRQFESQLLIHRSFIRVDKNGKTFARADKLADGSGWRVLMPGQPFNEAAVHPHEVALTMMQNVSVSVALSTL